MKKDWIQQNIKAWNELSEQYAEQFMEPGVFKESYDALVNLLIENGSVLEIACGPGNIYSYISSMRPDLDFLLSDSSENMIGQVVSRFPHVATQVLTTREIDTLEQRFDAIVAGFVLPYIDIIEIQKLMRDVQTILRKDGVFYFSYILGNGEQIDKRREFEMKQYRYSKAEIWTLIDNSQWKIEVDLTVEDPDRSDEFYHILILRKK